MPKKSEEIREKCFAVLDILYDNDLRPYHVSREDNCFCFLFKGDEKSILHGSIDLSEDNFNFDLFYVKNRNSDVKLLSGEFNDLNERIKSLKRNQMNNPLSQN